MSNKTRDIVDFTVETHGTIWTFVPVTVAARDHAASSFPEDTPTLGLAYAVEHRFAPDIVGDLLKHGYGVELDGHPIELRTLH